QNDAEFAKLGEPCNHCPACIGIDQGQALDIIEIDAASNRGIDEIRNLKESVRLSPTSFRKKIFIIDEAHMLTKEAFNALLKLIEEPPAHTVFIMCTTDPEKIPETIISRLLRIDFRKGKADELTRSLERVIAGEKIEIDEKSKQIIVSKSDGSFRNLHKTFNEMVMEFGKKIEEKQTKAYFASHLGAYEGGELEDDLVAGKTKIILEKLEKMAEVGVDFSLLRQKYLFYFQKRLLASLGVGELAGPMGGGELKRWLGLLIEVGKYEKEVEIEQLPLQLAVADFLKDKKEEVVEKKEENKERKPVLGKIALAEVEKKWASVLAAVKPFNHSVEAFMRSARPKKVEGEVLTLEVFYPFHKEKLEEAKNKKIMESGILKVFDCQMLVDCVLGESRRGEAIEHREEVIEEDKNKDMYDVAKEIFG
ncbi:AAA family ATPase, partial [Patescibacteria group bacterium]|nr:AAA family ATPase [Patescibacteria group bacterium]